MGTVVRIEGSLVRVRVDGGERKAILGGALKAGPRTMSHPVTIGDRIEIEEEPRGDLMIRRIEERRNLVARVDPGNPKRCHGIASNIDQIVCVQAFRDPPLNLRALDRYLLLGEAAGVPAVIVLNKSDLHHGPPAREIAHYTSIGFPVIETSARRGDGALALRHLLLSRVSVVVGPSGVGKSSLLNALFPGLHLRTEAVSRATSKGVHTTTRVEWIDLPEGGVVLDTPGLRLVQPWGLDPANLGRAFPEFVLLTDACRFRDCRHRNEPSCAVRDGVARGRIPAFRYDSYLRILNTMAEETGRRDR